MELDAVRRSLVENGLYVRPTPFSMEGALFVSRRDLRFEAEDGLHGWRESFLLRREQHRWVVSRALHGKAYVDEIVFSSLDEVVRYAHQFFNASLLSMGANDATADVELGEEVSESFWDIIHRANGQAEELKRILWEMSEAEVAQFHEEFVRTASVLRGEPFDRMLGPDVSEDGLMDIAYWSVVQGREFYESILKRPETIPRWVSVGDPALMHHVTSRVFKEKFGKELDFF
ncbi:hypothetical protein MYSTI_00615 [Myxococcus stipitatus DSM 14675]|uniref:DUF4240 domain-containing protein n=1 Tax=Myxococcus stipitatus (strain DSM 14675 / JCM 12634 / Mx s8) TaxID=1278073 RepID=L7U2D9_MYXSD|nr:DUF4240 domain-containing protein [Myxococcus stipitatus]AGC41965.1 hypothetical protein MYSTI_00615 [Myxococcus stipitatus DSM 14675]